MHKPTLMDNILFESISDSDLTSYSLDRMRELRGLLEMDFGKTEYSSYAHTISMLRKDNGYIDIIDRVDSRGLDYTLLACLRHEADALSDSDLNEIYNTIAHYYGHSIHSDLITGGVQLIWRSVGIKHEGKKKVMVRRMLSSLIAALRESQYYKIDSYSDLSRATISITEGDNKFDKESFFHPFSDTRFLTDDTGNRREKSRLFFEQIPKQERSRILYRWLLPLCHMAYLDNAEPRLIMDSARDIIDGIADAHEIKTESGRELFQRRCLCHIAIGFEGLMNEVRMTRDDVLPLRPGELIELSDEEKEYLTISPVCILSHSDFIATAYNDRQMLLDNNIGLGIDELMEIEKEKVMNSISALGAHIEISPSLMTQAAEHPEWMKIPYIILYSKNMIAQFSNQVYGSIGTMSLDMQIAILRREGAGLRTHPALSGKWTRDEQRQIVSELTEEGLFTASVYNIVKPDTDIVMEFSGKLPRSLYRLMIEEDLGV